MNTQLTIKNFRVFDEYGTDIELAPITILTGKNSAGKSSIVKAIALLNSFLMQIRKDKVNKSPIEFSKYKLEFNKVFGGTLGNFCFVHHRGSVNPTLTFEYVTHSPLLFKDVKVSFTFKDEDEGKDDKHLHNGILYEFRVMTIDGDVIYSSSDYNFQYNLNLITDSFCDFAYGEYLANVILKYIILPESSSRKEQNDFSLSAKENYEKLNENVRKDIQSYLRDPFSYLEPIARQGNVKSLFSLREGAQFFSFSVIDECLGKLKNSDVITKVEEILDNDDKIDYTEKKVIKRFINDILDSGKNIEDYWKERELDFLRMVSEEGSFLKLHDESVIFPDLYTLNVGNNGHISYRYHNSNHEDKNIGDSIKKWLQSLHSDFLEARYELVVLNNAYLRKNHKKEIDNTSFIYEYDENHGLFEHPEYRMLCAYASRVIENLLFPVWCENFSNISSSRALPKRLYTPDADNEFYNTLNNYLIALSEYETYQNIGRNQNKNKYIPNTFLNKWIGSEGFALGKTISVESIMGSAILVKLIKNNGAEVFLTDEGYGLTQLVSILINVETAILKARGVKYNIFSNQETLDGLDINKFKYELQTIAVEEPEIHLHPDFQSKLADMFVDASEYNIHFIVETHSEYLIRKLQLLVTGHIDGVNANRSMVSIYYINSAEDKSKQKVKRIRICKDGYLDDTFGEGFYDEAIKLSRQLM